MGISRRELFKQFGQGALCLAVSNFTGLKGAFGQSAGMSQEQEVDYRNWEDLYRKKWTWDKIAYCTHPVVCQAQCQWAVFVKDGVAIREEQIEHPRRNPGEPDPGPQGCQKGACYTSVMYAPDRLKYPLKRVGKRGEGKWMRVSWDEALTETADAFIDAIVKDQGCLGIHDATGGQGGGSAFGRVGGLMGITTTDSAMPNSDQNMGLYATFGSLGHPRDGANIDYGPPSMYGIPNITSIYSADLIFIWHMNPVYTWIPHYKEFSQARYRGAQIIAVAPDVNPSTVHADYWIPVEPGNDCALALGMSQVIVEEKLYKAGYLKEQTDLPFLVRDDTQKFLRQTDLQSSGREDQFYVYDLKTKKVVPARRDTLELGSVDPALEGRYEAVLSGGRKVQVRPVFDRLKEMLNKDYRPEQAAEIISRPFAKVHPDVIREVARKAAKAKTMAIASRFNSAKFYHVDLINRTMSLFMILCGQARPGGDERTFFEINGGWSGIGLQGLALRGPNVEDGVEGFNKRVAEVEEVMKADPSKTIALANIDIMTNRAHKPDRSLAGWQWPYYRLGHKDRWNNKQWHDPHYRNGDFQSYLDEANQEGWVVNPYILPENAPRRDRVLIFEGANHLRKMPGNDVLYNEYIPSLEKIIAIDTRMGGTTFYADIVLPNASFFEHLKLQRQEWLIDKAVEPIAETKNDWDIGALLAKKISQRAKERNIPKIDDKWLGTTLELDKLYDRYTLNGTYKEGDEEKIIEMVYKLRERLGISPSGTNLEVVRKAKGIPPTITPRPSFTRPPFGGAVAKEKAPHPTLTHRMQLYLDHDWFIEAGEALPVHRPHPLLGGDYPFHQTGGHGRESIHTIWITNPLILRLTRGVPPLLMNKQEAERMGIGDHEEVEVYNDSGLYRVRVKHSALMRPNQVAIYHCWENYQLSKGQWNAVNPSTAKPLLLAGGYGHINYHDMVWQPNGVKRGARVGIRKISA